MTQVTLVFQDIITSKLRFDDAQSNLIPTNGGKLDISKGSRLWLPSIDGPECRQYEFLCFVEGDVFSNPNYREVLDEMKQVLKRLSDRTNLIASSASQSAEASEATVKFLDVCETRINELVKSVMDLKPRSLANDSDSYPSEDD